MRAVVYDGKEGPSLRLKLEVERSNEGLPTAIFVRTTQGHIFGPQPFLAIESKRRGFIHDNFDFTPDGGMWRYVFDKETVVADDVIAVGVGAADRFGNTAVEVTRFDD